MAHIPVSPGGLQPRPLQPTWPGRHAEAEPHGHGHGTEPFSLLAGWSLTPLTQAHWVLPGGKVLGAQIGLFY